MLDSTSCILSDGSWLTFKGAILMQLLKQLGTRHGISLLVATIAAIAFVYPKVVQWFFPKYQARLLAWRRRMIRVGLVAFVMGLVLVSPLGLNWANWGLLAFLPADSGEPADAIVILGRGAELQQERVEVAAELWEDNRAPLIFASGRGDAPGMLEALRQMGIPETALEGENCSKTTEENAKLSAYMLHPRGVHRILLITDAPHMQRSRLTLQSFGFEVIPHFSSGFPALGRQDNLMLLLYEYSGLLSYALKGRFFSRDVPQLPLIAQVNAPRRNLPHQLIVQSH